MKHLLFLTLPLTLCFEGAQATNYYASPNGTGTGASITAPTTLSKGISKLAAGDSLFLLGGQYDLTATLTINKTGREDAVVFIGAYGDEQSILDFRKEPYSKNGVSLKGQYTHLCAITIRYAGYKGIWNQGSYNTLERLDVYGCCDSGIQHRDGVANLILNCDSHDNFDYQTGGSTDNCDFGGNADGFADKQHDNSPGNTYIGCRSWNNSDDGWDFYQRVGGTTTFIGCICYANGPQYYDMSQHPRLQTDAAWFAQFEGGTTVTTAKGVKHECSIDHYYNNGNGNGFKLGGNNTRHDVALFRCLSVGNTVKGYDQNNNAGSITIYNCSAYQNAPDYGFTNANGYRLDIANCVSLGSHGSNVFAGNSVTQRSNTWNTGYSCTTADFASLDTTLIILPREADGSLPVTDFMRLVAGSSLIDRGAVVDGIDYTGGAPDLGCYEYDGLQAAIRAVETSVPATSVEFYTLSGRRIPPSTLTSGIYILRHGGNSRKVRIP